MLEFQRGELLREVAVLGRGDALRRAGEEGPGAGGRGGCEGCEEEGGVGEPEGRVGREGFSFSHFGVGVVCFLEGVSK